MYNRNKFIFIISVAVCAYIAWSFVDIFISNNKKSNKKNAAVHFE